MDRHEKEKIGEEDNDVNRCRSVQILNQKILKRSSPEPEAMCMDGGTSTSPEKHKNETITVDRRRWILGNEKLWRGGRGMATDGKVSV